METPGYALSEIIGRHATSWPEESMFIPRFRELLLHPSCFNRNHLPGHITGSSWILDASMHRVLLVHHRKLGRWLQPGGHADGDSDVVRVARREAFEETGLQPDLMENIPWDIDIHRIPARPDFPEHEHYDVRYLFVVLGTAELRISEESTDAGWYELDKLNTITDSPSILRMAEKTIQRFHS